MEKSIENSPKIIAKRNVVSGGNIEGRLLQFLHICDGMENCCRFANCHCALKKENLLD